MLKAFTECAALACAAMLAGCAEETTGHQEDAPIDEPAHGTPAIPYEMIRLTSLEDVVDQVSCSAKGRLRTWCAAETRATDAVALRVIHPLHPDTFVDVNCDRILAQECTSTSASPLEVDGPLGEAAQPATPLALGCFLTATAISTLGMFTCKRHPKDKYCDNNLWGSGIAMGAVCLLF